MRHQGRGPNPEGRTSRKRGWWRSASLGLVGVVAVTSAALPARSDSTPASGPGPAETQVASLHSGASPAHELSGRFALPDAEVVGSFRWFEVAPGAPRFAPGRNPERLGRVEARGHETAIVAWFGDDELRIFRSETPRGTAFRCGCTVELEAVPTPGPAPSRMLAEALSCMELPVGRGGLKMRVTRERELQGVGAITRSVRGMPGRGASNGWDCHAPEPGR